MSRAAIHTTVYARTPAHASPETNSASTSLLPPRVVAALPPASLPAYWPRYCESTLAIPPLYYYWAVHLWRDALLLLVTPGAVGGGGNSPANSLVDKPAAY
eukprot:6232685-Pyramimonas_sp.AAC.2